MSVADTKITNTLIERQGVVSSQNRVYTKHSDREAFGMDVWGGEYFIELSEDIEGVKESATFYARVNNDGEFFIPVDVMNKIGLEVGDSICYRIY